MRRATAPSRGEDASLLTLSAFPRHMAALDQEQTAAGAYAESIGELERWLPDPDSDQGSEPPVSRGLTAVRLSA